MFIEFKKFWLKFVNQLGPSSYFKIVTYKNFQIQIKDRFVDQYVWNSLKTAMLINILNADNLPSFIFFFNILIENLDDGVPVNRHSLFCISCRIFHFVTLFM